MKHSLLEIEPGKKAIIERLRGGRAVFSRLITLGFTQVQPLRSSGQQPWAAVGILARFANCFRPWRGRPYPGIPFQ